MNAAPPMGLGPQVFDPFHGVAHWQAGLVCPVGDPADRIREHPVRWLRYYRKAHVLGFAVDPSIRKVDVPTTVLDGIPPEAVAAELRAALLDAPCPGTLLMEWFEAGILRHLLPELAAQFDGRPAGPVRHHPEIGQALHMLLVLRWAVATLRAEGERWDADARARVMVATLCHDLGKGRTPRRHWPAHHGHEGGGVPLVEALLDRLPGLTDRVGRRLARDVCAFHLEARQLHRLKATTLAKRYRSHFRDRDYPLAEFALAVAADAAGRLGQEAAGARVRAQVEADLLWLRERCGAVDAAALRARVEAEGGDLAAFQDALHRAQAAALRGGPPSTRSAPSAGG